MTSLQATTGVASRPEGAEDSEHNIDIDVAGLAKITVLDEDGNKVEFGSLFREQKTVAIFIRHFHCSACKLYMEDVAKVREQALKAAGVRILFVGCGEPSYIKSYREETGFQGAGYADPTRTIYTHLGFTSNLRLGPGGDKRKEYLQKQNRYITILTGVMTALKSPIDAALGRNGNVSQLGGELVLGPGNICTFAHRMKHTQDHAEVADVMRAAGVSYP